MAQPAPDEDQLAALRERIRATAAAADRLAGEAAAGRGAGHAPPPTDEATQEVRALVALAALLRDLLPEELRRQVVDLVRQVLMLVRAVIDHYLARLEPDRRHAPPPRDVQDIPLD